jgi:hypothetical protein
MQRLAGEWRKKRNLEFTVTVNWRRVDVSIATTQLATLDRGACCSVDDVGLQLADTKPILERLQEIVVREHLQRLSRCTILGNLESMDRFVAQNGRLSKRIALN